MSEFRSCRRIKKPLEKACPPSGAGVKRPGRVEARARRWLLGGGSEEDAERGEML
jgi:hypothetical protein